MLIFYVLSLCSGMFAGAKTLASRKYTDVPQEPFLLAILLFGLVVSVIIWMFSPSSLIPDSPLEYFSIVGVRSMLDVCTGILSLYAVRHVSVSVVASLTSLTPLYLLVYEIVLKGFGVASVFDIVGVALILSAGIFVAVFGKRPGAEVMQSHQMLGTLSAWLVGLLWAVATALHSQALTFVSPSVYSLESFACMFVIVFTITCIRKRLIFTSRMIGGGVLVGGASGVEAFTQMWAQQLGSFVVVSAFKRLSVVWVMVGGFFLFKERLSRVQIVAIVLSFLGVLAIVLG